MMFAIGSILILILSIMAIIPISYTEEAKMMDRYWKRVKYPTKADWDQENMCKKSRNIQKMDIKRMLGKPEQDVEVEWGVENPDQTVEFETIETWKPPKPSKDIATVRYLQDNGNGVWEMKAKEVPINKVRLQNGDIIGEIPRTRLSDVKTYQQKYCMNYCVLTSWEDKRNEDYLRSRGL